MERDTIRLFAAIGFDEALVDWIDGRLARLRRAVPGMRWVQRAQLHVTLRFLGEQPVDRVPEVGAALAAACEGQAPLTLALTGPGFFPPHGLPRVAWLGLRDEERALHRLARRVDEELAARGFGREERPFQPHLTLGRMRRGQRPRGLAEALAGAFGDENGKDMIQELRVHHVGLWRSELRPEGARYTVLERWALRGGREER